MLAQLLLALLLLPEGPTLGLLPLGPMGRMLEEPKALLLLLLRGALLGLLLPAGPWLEVRLARPGLPQPLQGYM